MDNYSLHSSVAFPVHGHQHVTQRVLLLLKDLTMSRMWRPTPVTPACKRLRLEDYWEFEASLKHSATLSQKSHTQRERETRQYNNAHIKCPTYSKPRPKSVLLWLFLFCGSSESRQLLHNEDVGVGRVCLICPVCTGPRLTSPRPPDQGFSLSHAGLPLLQEQSLEILPQSLDFL